MTGGSEVVLTDPDPAEVRAALRRCAGADASSELELAVTEVVANAREHGRAPVEVRLRELDGQVRVTVCERGPGPAVGTPIRLPDEDAERGRGRWLVHHLVEVREHRTPRGYEVVLAARR